MLIRRSKIGKLLKVYDIAGQPFQRWFVSISSKWKPCVLSLQETEYDNEESYHQTK
jgi:hypothetical protein